MHDIFKTAYLESVAGCVCVKVVNYITGAIKYRQYIGVAVICPMQQNKLVCQSFEQFPSIFGIVAYPFNLTKG